MISELSVLAHRVQADDILLFLCLEGGELKHIPDFLLFFESFVIRLSSRFSLLVLLFILSLLLCLLLLSLFDLLIVLNCRLECFIRQTRVID